MSSFRIVGLVCASVLICFVGAIFYLGGHNRYLLLPQNNSMFVFDTKTQAINFCTPEACQLVPPNGGYNQVNYGMMQGGMQGMMQPIGNMMGQSQNMMGGGYYQQQPSNSPVSSLQTNPQQQAYGMMPGMQPMMMQGQIGGRPNMVPAGMPQGPQQQVMVPSALVPVAMQAAPQTAGRTPTTPAPQTAVEPTTSTTVTATPGALNAATPQAPAETSLEDDVLNELPTTTDDTKAEEEAA